MKVRSLLLKTGQKNTGFRDNKKDENLKNCARSFRKYNSVRNGIASKESKMSNENQNSGLQPINNFVIFKTESGKVNIDVFYQDKTLWLTQKTIAELFEKGRSTITEHLKKIFEDAELDEFSVCRDFRHTAEKAYIHNSLTHRKNEYRRPK